MQRVVFSGPVFDLFLFQICLTYRFVFISILFDLLICFISILFDILICFYFKFV